MFYVEAAVNGIAYHFTIFGERVYSRTGNSAPERRLRPWERSLRPIRSANKKFTLGATIDDV
jgi:hypothetical protein